MYQPWVMDDLQKFFDRFLYDKANDWDQTMPVRHSLLGFNRENVVNRPESSYPPDYVAHRTFYLDSKSGTMSEGRAPSDLFTTSYQSDSWDDDGVHFTHKFDSYTELIGFSQARLYMACADTNDMDVYVLCRKLDKDGKAVSQLNVPLQAFPKGTTAEDVPNGNVFKYLGPNGRLRASHRHLGSDPTLRKEQVEMLHPATAWHPHDAASESKIPPGQIVSLDIPVWPSGMIFDAGESIRLEVKGHEVTLPEFPALDRVPRNLNCGKHVIHTGTNCPSSITLSLVSRMV